MADGDSLTQRIYTELRRRIASGEIPAGARLRERDIAEELATSRVPVREALVRLEGDGFVETSPRRGASVIALRLVDVEELYDVRIPLEVQAARLAAMRVAGGADPRELVSALETADAMLARGTPDQIAEANAAVHDEILRLAGNTLLSKLMRPVLGRDRWIFGLVSRRRDPAHTAAEHRQICDAIVAGKADIAAAIAYAHVEGGRRATVEELRAILPA